MLRRTDPHLLGQQQTGEDPALLDSRPQRRFLPGEVGAGEPVATGSFGVPGTVCLAEAGGAPLVRCQMQAAAGLEFVVDAGLGAEFLGPFPVQSIGIGRQPVVRRSGGRFWCRRKNTGRRPRCGVAAGIAAEHADREAAAGKFTRDRQPDDAPADDAAVGHAGALSRSRFPRIEGDVRR